MYSKELQERFWEKVFMGKTDDCWLWKNYLDKDGYGTFYFNGKSMKAHRFSFTIYNELDCDMCVCHKCDIPACVNPKHLYAASHEKNMNDMKNKGRSRVSIGSKNVNTDLTETEVKEVLDMILYGLFDNKKDIIYYNPKFTRHNLVKIGNKKTWIHITNTYNDEEFEYIKDTLNNQVTRTTAYLIKKDLENISMNMISKKYKLSVDVIRKIKQGKHKYS
jgi:predicted DNA-binding protein